MFGLILIKGLLGNKYLIGAMAAVAVLCGVWFAGDRHGKLICQQEAQKTILEVSQAYSDQADKLRAQTVQREQKTKIIVKKVYREKDPTGCADKPALDSVLSALGGGADRSTAN